jgi:hypothetical protein
MFFMRTQKPSIIRKIIIKLTNILGKIKLKYQNSQEFKAMVLLVFDIVLTGTLLTLGFLAFTTGSLIFKVLGFGSLFWIIEKKIVEVLARILGSFRLVAINK